MLVIDSLQGCALTTTTRIRSRTPRGKQIEELLDRDKNRTYTPCSHVDASCLGGQLRTRMLIARYRRPPLLEGWFLPIAPVKLANGRFHRNRCRECRTKAAFTGNLALKSLCVRPMPAKLEMVRAYNEQRLSTRRRCRVFVFFWVNEDSHRTPLMWLAALRRLVARNSRSPQAKHSRSRRWIVPTLDYLEERIALTTWTVGAGDVSGLIGYINQANTDSLSGIADTINLTNSTYTISQVNNTADGANALPVITATNLTIEGNGATLDGASLARLFDVAGGAGLTLQDLLITHGIASGSNAQGGGLLSNGGNVTMTNVTFQFNNAFAGAGQNAQGARCTLLAVLMF